MRRALISARSKGKRRFGFGLEGLEPRLTLTVVCDANPTYAAECNYLGDLIPPVAITDTAIKSGPWSDPATWSGKVPSSGDNVWIPSGVTVTVDGQEPGVLRSVLVNGTLQFATNVNTSLLVDTIVVGTDDANGTPHGELHIGTLANPIQPGVTAKITFADTGSLAQAWPDDPEQLARGLISMNTVSIVGAEVTPYEQVAMGATAGSNSIALTAVPTGWKVGDTLLLPGASITSDQDEQIQIAAIDGNRISLSRPLAYSHSSAAGQPVYVANEARNVILQSQNSSDSERFGHVMFMHTDQEVVENAAFLNLGRTDKALPLGAINPDGTTNVVGRYALHFHRDYWPTLSQNDPPILVRGNFEMGSPGWGYDNHSSNVDMEDNVAFQNNGAAFVTEAGNEIGTFNANLAIRTTGVANGTDYSVNSSRTSINDFGFTGSGFWMQSPSCVLTNNIALDNTTGFQFYNLSISSVGLGQINAWNGQNTESIPLPLFSGNIAAQATDGLEMFWHLPVNMPLAPGTHSVIDNFTTWDVKTGVDLSNWTAHVTIQNSSLMAAPGSLGTGIRSAGDGYAADIHIVNDRVVGFSLGAIAPTRGKNSVEGGFWDDATAFEIPGQAVGIGVFNRQLSYSGITFGPNVYKQYQWDSQTSAESTDPNGDFIPQQIYIDGVQAFFANQGADFVPFSAQDANVPSALVGLTNGQIMHMYGLAMEGQLAGQHLESTPFWYSLSSPAKTSSPTYTLSYQTPTGTVTEPKPITLQPGWNLITRTVDGGPHSWLVGFNAPASAAPPEDGVNTYQVVGGSRVAFPVTIQTVGTRTEVSGTSAPEASARSISITSGGVVWLVAVEGNGLYIEKNGRILATRLIPPNNTYSFDVVLGTSLSVVINGTKYL